MIGDTPSITFVITENIAKKWSRPIAGTTAMTKRVLPMLTSAANKPMKKCNARINPRLNGNTFPATSPQPDTISIQMKIENVSTGLLPK